MTLKVYSANEHTLNFAGIPIESGRGDDEFLAWEQDGDNFAFTSGVDGEGTRSEMKRPYTKLTVTLMQTSSGNDVLSGIWNGDIRAPGGSGVAPVMARDRQGTTSLASAEAWILGPPAQKRGAEVGTLEWQLGVFNATRFDGGS